MTHQQTPVPNLSGNSVTHSDNNEACENSLSPITAPQKKILIVDDELAGLKKIHVKQVASDFYEVIEDSTHPVFVELWNLSKSINGINAIDWNEEEACDYLNSEIAVSKVLLSDQIKQLPPTSDLIRLLSPFIARADRIRNLRTIFEKAFPAGEYELFFVTAPRPEIAEVLNHAAIFLDLFLEQGEASPVETVQKYLKKLATDAGNRTLPPIVVMSSHPELLEYKLGFSQHATISAAGLMVLPKSELTEPEFSDVGLSLAFKQLERQKDVAHAMRVFMRTWLQALESAKDKAAQTLWNIDAAAMQQIHFASISDDDPYDEHLNQFISREYSYHVETEKSISLSISELDKCFRGQLDATGRIAYKLISPMADITTTRSLISHYNWLGSVLPSSFMCDELTSARNISRTLPFGSVLIRGEVKDGSECLIHITQQCDLNSISRNADPSKTLIFGVARATQLFESSNPVIDTQSIVAKGLRIQKSGKTSEFDLEIKPGSLVALTLREFLEKSRLEEWYITARLRSDIANHIVAAITNHISRPASQKVIRPGLYKAKIFLQHKSLNDKKVAFSDKATATSNKSEKIISVLSSGNIYSFEDRESINIALWLRYHLQICGMNVDPDLISQELRKGWLSKRSLTGNVRIKVIELESLEAAVTEISDQDLNGIKAQLSVVIEKE